MDSRFRGNDKQVSHLDFLLGYHWWCSRKKSWKCGSGFCETIKK